jgi:hypothetical protein
MEEVTAASTDDVQDALDRLVLNIFEDVRSHPEAVQAISDIAIPLSEEERQQKILMVANEKSNMIIEAYKHALNTVDRLEGINRSREEQEKILQDLSNQYASHRENVLNLEQTLIQLSKNVDEKLEEELQKANI